MGAGLREEPLKLCHCVMKIKQNLSLHSLLSTRIQLAYSAEIVEIVDIGPRSIPCAKPRLGRYGVSRFDIGPKWPRFGPRLSKYRLAISLSTFTPLLI